MWVVIYYHDLPILMHVLLILVCLDYVLSDLLIDWRFRKDSIRSRYLTKPVVVRVIPCGVALEVVWALDRQVIWLRYRIKLL